MTEDGRIIVFGENVGYQCGGAEKSTYAMMRHVRHNRVQVVYMKDEKLEKCFEKLPYRDATAVTMTKVPPLPYVQYFINAIRMKKIIRAWNPHDLLITQGLSAPLAVNLFSGKAVVIMTDESALNVCRCWERGTAKIIKYWIRFALQLPFFLYYCRENRKAMKKAGIVLAYSKYFAEKAQHKYGRPVHVMQPFVDVSSETPSLQPLKQKREYIMLVGDHVSKGVTLFEKIAACLPGEKFMVVGKSKCAAVRRNITYEPYSYNPVHKYQKAKLVLMPSLWEEAFGMVAAEASILGIPVLVSRRGGLPEVVPESSVIKEYRNVERWVEEIKRVLAREDGEVTAPSSSPLEDNSKKYARFVHLVKKYTGFSIEGDKAPVVA